MTVEMSGVTSYEFHDFKQLLDASVRRSTAFSLLRTEWHGMGYRATAPGVAAFGRFQDGEVRVKIMISFPATMMRGQIVGDIVRSMRDAGVNDVRST